eukprot:6496531-Pyramimonas_sp.AAC.1
MTRGSCSSKKNHCRMIPPALLAHPCNVGWRAWRVFAPRKRPFLHGLAWCSVHGRSGETEPCEGSPTRGS